MKHLINIKMTIAVEGDITAPEMIALVDRELTLTVPRCCIGGNYLYPVKKEIAFIGDLKAMCDKGLI